MPEIISSSAYSTQGLAHTADKGIYKVDIILSLKRLNAVDLALLLFWLSLISFLQVAI